MKDNKVEIMALAEILSEQNPNDELVIEYMNIELKNNLDEKLILAKKVIDKLGKK